METLSLNMANQTGAFSDKNAGVGKTVTVAGIRLSGTDAGNDVLNTTCLSQLDSTFDASYGHLKTAMQGFLRGW